MVDRIKIVIYNKNTNQTKEYYYELGNSKN